MANSYFHDRGAGRPSDGVSSPQTPSTPLLPRSNALQTRIASVLSASYADLEIRDTLNIIDQRHLSNSADTRRNLRLDVQDELIQCNGEIVQDFGLVASQLKRIGAAISSLNGTCEQMRRHINAASRDSKPMLDEANTLIKGKVEVDEKARLHSAFTKHFVISDADLSTLTSMNEPVNDDFFRVLTRVKKLHADSQVLLGSEDQRLGLEILDASSKQLNAAFQKLYRWVQREFKTLDLENPQISSAIRRALRVLAGRPTLFRNCIDAFAEARETIMSNNFYAALTGAPVDQEHPVMGKAIELSAHDPLRYVSDMLAWAHSATVSEREALEVLFISEGDEIAKNIQAGIESEPWTRAEDDETKVFNPRKALDELTDRDLTGVFRQLCQRTEQVIRSHEDAVLAYKISNLINFYTTIFTSVLGPASSLLSTLSPLADTALRSFRSLIRDNIAALHVEASVSPSDHTTPDFLFDALSTLTTLMQSYDTSAAADSDLERRREGFRDVLKEALDPYLSACENVTKRLRNPGKLVFALNCLTAAETTLKRYAFADRSEELRPKIEAQVNELTEVVHLFLGHESGLDPLRDSVASPEDVAANVEKLETAARRLDAFLPSASDDARTLLEQLEDKAIVRRVVEDACERFVEDFEEVEGWVLEADEKHANHVNGDVDEEYEVLFRDVFPRTSGETRAQDSTTLLYL
ncbi:Golgi transport complex subunit 6 [Oleoguttula sp. CCFEE 5521]